MSIALKSIAAGSAFGLGFVTIGSESFTVQFFVLGVLVLAGLARELTPDVVPAVQNRPRTLTLQ